MADIFSLIPLNRLLNIILKQYDSSRNILGINEELFFNPKFNESLRFKRFGSLLETPIGVAAGPQTQLSQNIVAAWLTGARFIELKTIQTIDEIEVSKPCIDMQDEGYNCEWSQELKIKQSFDQYLNAWIIIHILSDKFGWANSKDIGVIFNMSVGYDYDGIQKENVQWFFKKMADASKEITEKVNSIESIYPNVVNITINPTISNNITLSTMHGCPPDEIEKIGEYLITEKKLHTAIKLNPTLIGKKKLNEIIVNSGFETIVPDIAFEHDLKYKDAISIITNLRQSADNNNLQFSVKLTNTLESLNNKDIFPEHEKMMYMSGRALHQISINLAYELQNEFDGGLDISFSGGVDAFNVADVVNCGLAPVTVCTDLLKPGGYGRLCQYIEELKEKMKIDCSQIDYLKNLKHYVEDLIENSAYKKHGFNNPSIKTNRQLKHFDCTHAPCVDTCPTNQGIPDYMYYTSKGEFDKAAEVIQQTNPFPHTTGMICDHLCQTKCTRINYDKPVLIREIKRTISENSDNKTIIQKKNFVNGLNKKAAIIGAGPSGLSCAYFLALAGMDVVVYESKTQPGGMVSGAIPSFRLTNEAIDIDIKKIESTGVVIKYNHPIFLNEFNRIRKDSDYIYIGIGAQVSEPLLIEGIESPGVLDPLDFLVKVKEGQDTEIGQNIVIIGGGNTAMDAARTAYRLVGENGKVTVIYRRTIKQMPADFGEINAVIKEGINILELTAPLRINSKNTRVFSITCRKMKLGKKDDSGRARPVEIYGSEFDLLTDTVIPAIGQNLDIDFMDVDNLVTKEGSYQTKIPNVFIGGDALRGASTAINAIGDGRKAAQEIIKIANIDFSTNNALPRKEQNYNLLMIKKASRLFPQSVRETSLHNRKNFNLVSTTLTAKEAIMEASRCLLCDEVCNICATVCPNLAFHSYNTEPVKINTQIIKIVDGNHKLTEGNTFEIVQKHQILHIADWCNQCGNCTTFCPTSGSPYLDKPHLYLVRKEFEKNKDGYFLDVDIEITELLYYQNDRLFRYYNLNDYSVLETDLYTLKANRTTLRFFEIDLKEKINFEEDLTIAAEMSLILQGAVSFYG
ncbi:MAG: putative selenate reductase subunit YgfK [Bacteroidetes bacterium]|nr:putative selenate reductase subunit YgfK [Bacteroidota bacterium]MBL6943306.1 putative selenate reductase subunit YgfK [Bacteroidales bacterium]